MAMSDGAQRDVVCGLQLLSVAQSSSTLPGAASNALALMAAANYPMQQTDLRSQHFKYCNLLSANLDGARLRGATFTSCTLTGSSIIEEGVTFEDCEFGDDHTPVTHGEAVKQPITEECCTSISAIGISVDSRVVYVADTQTADDDIACAVRVFDALTGKFLRKLVGHTNKVIDIIVALPSNEVMYEATDEPLEVLCAQVSQHG